MAGRAGRADEAPRPPRAVARPPLRLGSAPRPARPARADRPAQPAARSRTSTTPGRGPLDRRRVDDHPDYLTARTLDGTLQRPRRPAHGQRSAAASAATCRSTRRPPSRTTALLEPNPRTVSRELLTRDEFQPGDDAEPARRRVDPVRGARLVQPRQERAGEPVADRSSRTTTRGPSTRCRSSARAATRAPTRAGPPTFVTDDTPLVGRLADLRPRRRRSPTALRAGERRQAADRRATGCCPPTSRRTSTSRGVAGNFWVGLALLHTLFMREHNAICDLLHAAHPTLDRPAALRPRRGSSTPR